MWGGGAGGIVYNFLDSWVRNESLQFSATELIFITAKIFKYVKMAKFELCIDIIYH